MGFDLVINKIPLNALAPYKAEDALEVTPHFEHQSLKLNQVS
jgi:hypothetical protein